ncbi:MAG TPA: methionine--tRNA ligase [Bacteroidales bacterium]|nr:methionine--tRNA ligase [Bacteroidales bacterium]
MDPKEKKYKRTTVTSALPYANGPVHIGHLAGVYIPADIYVRYLRMKGEDVVFIGGSDEHGVPITIKARKEGITPQQVVDKYHKIIKDSFEEFGISFDIYSRTSNKVHHETASEIFRTLYDKGEFVVKTSDQLYDEEQKQFLADRYVTGTCPHCNNDRAYGDQCESCGTSLNATDLINPRSALSGNIPVMKQTKHWYLPLDNYEPWLKQWILVDHKEWKTNVYGQCKSWLDQGLQPRAVTRDLDWGVKVPVEGADGKVLYVWFDAPIGYISATKEWAAEKGKNWELYWKDKETRLLHFIGKDNIVFHCIIFPAILHAEGSYILPDNVPANEFLNLESDKISTSRNWAVWLHEYLADFPGKQDVLRYVLTANAPETKDNDFTWKDFQTKNNSELVAILGNFVNRAVVLTQKFYNGVVPSRTELTEIDRHLIEEIKAFPERIASSIDNFRFREALGEMMNLARLGNKYLADSEPWKIFSTNPERVQTILNLSLQICANLAVVTYPFLPFTSEKIKKMLNLEYTGWSDSGSVDMLKENSKLVETSLLFEKIEDNAILAQVEKLNKTKELNSMSETHIPPAKQDISYEEFAKLDIRTGTILTAERVPKTDKLLKLTVDTGLDKRTVVSGIAANYDPEKIIGQKVVILVNLQPRMLRGIQSQGMILMAENSKGELCFVHQEKDFENGAVVK